MRIVNNLLRAWIDIVAALISAGSYGLDVAGLVKTWKWLPLIFFGIFVVLVYYRVFTYKRRLDERQKWRMLADKLSQFLVDGDQLRAKACKEIVPLDEIEKWMAAIYKTLQDKADKSYARLFTVWDLSKNPPPNVEGFKSIEQQTSFRQIEYRMSKLQTIIEDCHKKASS